MMINKTIKKKIFHFHKLFILYSLELQLFLTSNVLLILLVILHFRLQV